MLNSVGEVLHQECPEVHGPQPEAPVQLCEPEVPGSEGDDNPPAERVLRQTQPLFRHPGEHQRHGGDDPLPGPLPQRVSIRGLFPFHAKLSRFPGSRLHMIRNAITVVCIQKYIFFSSYLRTHVELVNILLGCGEEVRMAIAQRVRMQCEQNWGALCDSLSPCSLGRSDNHQHITVPPAGQLFLPDIEQKKPKTGATSTPL